MLSHFVVTYDHKRKLFYNNTTALFGHFPDGFLQDESGKWHDNDELEEKLGEADKQAEDMLVSVLDTLNKTLICD